MALVPRTLHTHCFTCLLTLCGTFVALLRTHSDRSMSFSCWAPEQVRSHESGAEGENPLPGPTGHQHVLSTKVSTSPRGPGRLGPLLPRCREAAAAAPLGPPETESAGELSSLIQMEKSDDNLFLSQSRVCLTLAGSSLG